MRLQPNELEPGAQPPGAAWSLGPEAGETSLSATEAERLEYLCDMLGELRSMAEQTSLRRLAAILSLAHEEARRKLDSR